MVIVKTFFYEKFYRLRKEQRSKGGNLQRDTACLQQGPVSVCVWRGGMRDLWGESSGEVNL